MSPTDAEVTELPASPGARLRREREARGMTEQQAAEALNLDAAAVTSIELNDFSALGAPVFVRGHLRRYAALLELAEEEVLGAYDRSKQQVDEPTLVPRARLEMMPARNKPRWPWVLGGALAFLLAAAAVAYLSENGLPWTRATQVEGAGAAAEEAAATPAIAQDRTVANLPADAGAAAASEPSRDGAQPFASQSSLPEAGAAAAAGAAPSTSVPTAAPLPGQVVLQLRFSADSWVEIFDGSGKAVVFELGKAGTERNLTATAPLSVTLGNGPGVAVTVNGRSQVPPGAGGQALVRFSVAPDGSLR
jgi:cytoskeleton protein RodZ